MKKFKQLVILLIATIGCNMITEAQSAWTVKTPVSGELRFAAVSFSIGNKGYLGTGYGTFNTQNDFWEYDPVANTWTQKANVGGLPRYQAVGFSCNGKGYIGMGFNFELGMEQNDFWEYNPVTNTWTAKANYPGLGQDALTGFGIGTKGYVGTGEDIFGNPYDDFYEYNPANDTWTQKANFIGGGRCFATGFSIGSKGYLGTGLSVIEAQYDFYEYNPATDTWTQKADYAGGGDRMCASSFATNGKGYLIFGDDNGTRAAHSHRDMWEYDPTNDSWTLKESFPGARRAQATAFAVNGKGYVGTGIDSTISFVNDITEFNPAFCLTVATPPVITGPSVVCGVLHPVYKAVSTGSSSYQWTVPAGITINSGQGTGSITTTVAAGTVIGNIICTAINACGSSTTTNFYVTKKPGVPGTITGTSLCGNSTATYSVAPVFGATSYNWSVPTGLTIAGAANGTSITVSKSSSFIVGNISVSAVNACGSVPGAVKTVYGKVPATPAPLSGSTSVCAPSTSSYTTAGSNGAISYSWSVTGNATVSGSGTSATVNFGSSYTTGTLSVIANNPCGNSYARTITIQKVSCLNGIASQNNELKSLMIDGEDFLEFNLYPNPVSSSFNLDIHSDMQQSAVDSFQLIMEIYDVLGNKVMQSKIQNSTSEINMETLKRGMYFVRVLDGDLKTRYSQRVIKE